MNQRSITYAGHSAVFLEIAGKRVAIDPWLQGNPLCPETLQNPDNLDIIALTHGHSDHAGDVVRLSKLSTAYIAATFELAMILIGEGIPAERVIPMNKGGAVRIDRVSLRLTNALHSSSYDTANGTVYAGEACGVMVSSPEWSVYHAGDTELFSDMRLIGELYAPDVALLPIGDRFTMGPREAARAASMVKCKLAIPIHHKTFSVLTGTSSEFSAECSKYAVEMVELQPGATRRF
jgi:L-ascorbate metabolism protein UlaG (beta-lactamase superfamily)